MPETENLHIEIGNNISYLLYFKLTLARPVDRDITVPRVIKVDNRVNFEEGDAGRREKAFRMAINNQLTT